MNLVVHFDLELHRMDVKTVFLNGDIDECIYISQPPNYESDDSKQTFNGSGSIHGSRAGRSRMNNGHEFVRIESPRPGIFKSLSRIH
jgi:Reverse transcriptase (RNA-dependent DNA polymerase)